MRTKPLLISLVGPTAIGKTAVSIELSRQLNADIISCDSRQFFKELAIGTAKPTEEERSLAPHHFVDFLSIEDEYSAGDFERDALSFLETYFKENSIAIVTGGSGLYLKALLKGFDDLPSDLGERAVLIAQFNKSGLKPLQDELKEKDPVQFERMDTNNHQRVMRALEVCRITNKPYSSYLTDKTVDRPFELLEIGITAERLTLYERINTRVDVMMEAGLLEEAKAVYPKRALNSLNTVGYKELFDFFDGRCSQEEAVEKIKQHTRNFAKRQMTWFKKNTGAKWFDISEKDELIAYAIEQSRKS
ncbi:MAG: tRNA (adenosine(37)-N6)-dimethylallyltransferase MiaA [Flavobacteriales bacterium]|nr:tRNA (adenosine(37)-N6)-dimethylallyltransferase MiaA [Flavobacteriales bacterium]MDG2247087.1 tRNA (adenosine(37)-N6)-dimethylallyltransferase MiaA [Flavobacteriales bacterium]